MSYRDSGGKAKKLRKPIGGSASKPEFIMIGNIYDDLSLMVDKYGITKVVEHLGCVASEKVSREFATKLWWIVSNKS